MYPITYEADFNPTPSRATTFFRILLSIPWLIVSIFWGILFMFTHLFAWIAIIILGRYPEWLFDFNSGVIRFGTRLTAWFYLQTDEWPPFGLSDDDNYPIRLKIAPRAELQSRLKALFRPILLIPYWFVLIPLAYIHYAIGMLAWLVIVFRGYMPEGIHNTLTFVNGLYARVSGYAAFLTDDYPPVGVEKANSAAGGVVPPPPPPPAAPAGL